MNLQAKTKRAKKAEAAAVSTDPDDDMIEVSRLVSMYVCNMTCIFSLKISNKRFVNVRVFNGRFLVDIREYWFDDAGVRKPGKKGELWYS